MQTRPAHYNTRYKHDLTPKQTAVLDLMAEGRTNAEIAERLGLTLDGAKWHVREILGKLGMESREEAVAWWRSYRRSPARMRRGALGLFALPIWKPAAIAGGALGVVAVAAGVLFAFRGGLGAGANGTDEPPDCTAENMRWHITPGAAPGSFGLAISLRDPDWYEGIFKTLRISDRKVDSPCLLDSTATVSLWRLEPIADWPGKPPAPLVLSGAIDSEPAGRLDVPVRAELRTDVLTNVLTVQVSNWCLPEGAYGAEMRIADMFEPTHAQGMTVPLETFAQCSDGSALPALTVTTP